MGRFFSLVQIKNNGSREQFLKAFCDVMKKRSFVPCSEEESSVSYILAFSESGKWVTLTCEAYRDDTNRVKTDAKQTATEMKTSSFSMDVVDSDFAVLELYKDSSAADTVIVGDGSGYGFDEGTSKKGKRDCWEQLLASGKTWEQLSEKWNKDGVFVEDTLYEAASVLGIEPKYMVSDYEDFESEADLQGRNQILYGHNMKNGSMFKDINRYKDPEYFKEHQYFSIYTPEREIRLKAVSCYYGEAKPIVRMTGFKTQETFDEFVRTMVEPCSYKEEVEYPARSIFTLVTCSYEINDARTFLFAVEVDEEGNQIPMDEEYKEKMETVLEKKLKASENISDENGK